MASIQSNLVSLFTQRSLAGTQNALSTSVERLSSGLRINRAKDDVAGLGISQELQRQVRATQVASRNAADAVSMTQVAEGSLQEVNNMLQRMKQLAVQGANESLSNEQRKYIADELVQLRDEINAVSTRTQFNGYKLLTGDFSHAVKGEFGAVNQLVTGVKSSLETSTIESGLSSADVVGKSVVAFGDITVSDAPTGTYQLSNVGADITLTATIDGVTSTQTLTLVDGAAAGRSQVELSDTVGGVTTLDFFKFGVEIKFVNSRVGSDHNAREIATKIVGAGTTANPDRLNRGWTDVEGADWATGSGTLKAVISSSGGPLRVTDTSQGVGLVTGYSRYETTLDAVSGRYEMAFTGTAAQLNATLATLQVNSATGLGDVSVEVVPENISVFTNPTTGTTSYYKVVSPGSITWSSARTAALASSFEGLNGYLANLTSTDESSFIQSKLSVNGWIGASDDYSIVNAAITARNALITSGDITGEVTNSASYANQAAAEGKWYWVDGPEGGLQFLSSNSRTATVSGGTGQVTTAYANWAVGEPNDAGGEHYAYAIGGGSWNDYPASLSVAAYVIEYGGYLGVSANTSKTILLGTPGAINVGPALSIDGVSTSSADTGIYRLSADKGNATATLRRFDTDGETLLQSQTIDLGRLSSIGSLRTERLSFDQLGVTVDLENLGESAVTLGSAESGLDTEFVLVQSRMASLIGENGPVFQVGEASRNDFSVSAFRDMRLGGNADAGQGADFNELDSLISNMAASEADRRFDDFQTLANEIDDVITHVTARRSDLGALQNRLASAIQNIGEQFANLSAAQSQILDTDFAAETARLTRMQIGQQASTAMLAQANQLPNVILALLQ